MMMMETETEVMWLDPREHLLLATSGTEKDARKETYRSRVALPQFQTSGIWNYERNTSIVSSPLPYDQLLWQTQKSNKLPLRKKSKRFLRGGRDIPTLSLDRGEGGPACPFMRWHFGRDTGQEPGGTFPAAGLRIDWRQPLGASIFMFYKMEHHE